MYGFMLTSCQDVETMIQCWVILMQVVCDVTMVTLDQYLINIPSRPKTLNQYWFNVVDGGPKFLSKYTNIASSLGWDQKFLSGQLLSCTHEYEWQKSLSYRPIYFDVGVTSEADPRGEGG